jgi:hypothetical protein
MTQHKQTQNLIRDLLTGLAATALTFGVTGCASAQQTTAAQTASAAQAASPSSSTLPTTPAPGAKPATAKNEHNYAEALQKSLFFFEAQQSGRLSPGNRVEWRGPAHLEDGKDVGRDLTGGWYDAGDHWKSNHTMAFAATNLAWSVVQFREAYQNTGQMDEVLDNIKHITDYFVRCTVDPNLTNLADFSQFELYMDIGNRIGPQPAVHSVWSAPEATGGFPLRESLKVNKDVPGADSAACMAATLASAAIAFHENGNAAQKTYAQQLLRTARKLFAFAEAFPTVKKNDKNEVVAIAPDGALRHVEYRSDQVRDELYFAAGWLQRAESRLATPGYDNRYLRLRPRLDAQGDRKEGRGRAGSAGVGRVRLVERLLPRQLPARCTDGAVAGDWRTERSAPWSDVAQIWDSNLWAHVKAWAELEATPFGLRVRDVYRGLNIKWTMNEAFIAALYSAHTDDAQRRDKAFDFAKSQMNYVLGDNFYNKSFMVGFGKDWFKTLHSRIAHGAWAGFSHINSNSPLYTPEMRHTQYGALLAGPNRHRQISAAERTSR